MSVDHFNIFQM